MKSLNGNPVLRMGIGIFLLLSGCKTPKEAMSMKKSDILVNKGQFTYKRMALLEEELLAWPIMDLPLDSIPGISLKRAIQFIEGKKASPITVAILDSGTDVAHDGLQSYLWTNPQEIKGNKRDDDGNGYVDDVHGWNFLGEAYGAPYALTRLVARCEAECPRDMASDSFCRRCPDLQLEYEEAMTLAGERYAKIQKRFDESSASEQQKDYYGYILDQNRYHYNLYFDPREIIGDDVNDIDDRFYGNADVMPRAKSETHGTHVTGIVTQLTGRFTDAIRFIPVRSTPNGDEYDKDVALAIRYAVDNGAKVINMSFGKSYSENPGWVRDAILYAAERDVLLVHAAGNNGKDVDKEQRFPHDKDDNGNEISDNFINVGSITRFFNEALVSEFSNYGKENVDIFAPGSDIHSTLPNNAYGYQRGTSMAAPAVTAIAALVRSYYPKLTATEVKEILMESGVEVPFEVTVPRRPGEKLPFSELCRSGRILNAYNALLMAENKTRKKR